jgi:hypothetical protein
MKAGPMTGPDRFGPARTAGPNQMSDVERLLAYEEIRQLAARYALAVDRRDVDALAWATWRRYWDDQVH